MIDFEPLAYVILLIFIAMNEYLKHQAKNMTARYLKLVANDYWHAYYVVLSNRAMVAVSTILFISLPFVPDQFSNEVVGFWILCSLLFLAVCTVYMKVKKVNPMNEKLEEEGVEAAVVQEKKRLAAEEAKRKLQERELKQREHAAQKKQEVLARMEQQMGPDMREGESGKVDLSWALKYGQQYGFFEDWDLERMKEFLEVEMDAEEFVELHHVPDLVEWMIVNSEWGWWLDHRFYSKDAVWSANRCLERFGISLDQGTYENNDVEIIDKDRNMRKTRIILKEQEPTDEGMQRMERSIEFYFLSVQDVACRINDLIEPEGLVFLKREESDDHYDFALVRKNQAQRIIRDSELGFVFPDRSELPEFQDPQNTK